MKKIVFQVQKDAIKAATIQDNKKMVVLGLFPVSGKTQAGFKNEISRIDQEMKLKADSIAILPEPGIYPNSEKWKLTKNQVSSLMARARFEAERGTFKKKGTYLLLEIGSSINLAVIYKNKEVTIHERNLDRLVADFHEAISEPHRSRYLQDFCSNHFFLKKTGQSGLKTYNEIQHDASSADVFVEFGANMGALLANLDTLYEPNCVAICGSLAQTFDAWSHAMGKMRNYHRGKKPACRVMPLKDKSDYLIIGANYTN